MDTHSVQIVKLILILVALVSNKVFMIQQFLHATLKGTTTEFKLENIQKR